MGRKSLIQKALEDDNQLFSYTDVSILDETNPFSLINLVTDDLVPFFKAIPHKYWTTPEHKLFKILEPDETDSRLRLTFWDEYNQSQVKRTRINISNVVRGVCSRDYFYETILRDPKKLAWVATPPKDYMITQRSLLDLGLMRMKEILETPFQTEMVIRDRQGIAIRNPDGSVATVKKIDPRVMGEIQKAVQMLDMRVKGAIVQKIAVKQETRNLHHVTSGTTGADPLLSERALSGLDLAMLEQLERRIETVQHRLGSGTTVGVGEGAVGTVADSYSDASDDEALDAEFDV